jgi:hypothetical protein
MIGRRMLAIGMIALFGAVRVPIETALDASQRAAGLRGTALNLDLREEIGQMGFLAALSGFRSPLAAFLWIDAHNVWERTEWGRMAGILNTVTTLQPRSLLYWDMSAWHMAWNASVAAREDPKQPSEALRIRNQRQYFQLGRDFLERGIRNNPDSYLLHERMGILLRDKFEDHCAAGQAFLDASKRKGAPDFVLRFAGYELAKCPGREKEAFAILKSLYEKGPDQRKPTLISTLHELEEKLDIPRDQRIPEQP